MSDNLNLKNKLSKLAFDVTQNSSTERAFSGRFWIFSKMVFTLVFAVMKIYLALNINLFLNQAGQVFYQPINSNVIKYLKDDSYGMIRVEVSCKNATLI